MLHAVIHPASVPDRDGVARVLDRRTRRRFPFLEVVFADQGYQGPKAASAVARAGAWTLDIVHRVAGQRGFAVLPMRWVVERTLSWLRRNRRLAKDVEHLTRTAEAPISLAMIKIMLRHLCRT